MFISIVYQLAVKFPLITDILEYKILQDPAVLTATLSVQFEELFIKFLYQITSQNVPIKGWVIILDSLDKVDTITAQTEIICIVATSICEHTIPFY